MVLMQTKWQLILSAEIVVALAIWQQTQFALNWDVSWDILIAKRMIAGGEYGIHFFDINPPLVFFLYMPVVYLQHLSVNVMAALFVTLLLYIGFTLLLSYFFLKKLILARSARYLFLLALFFVLFILPGNQFGQREHLALIFSLPYFFYKAYILTLASPNSIQREKISQYFSFFIILFASIGFLIKPFFLLPFILVELYAAFYQRSFLVLLNPQNLFLLFLQLLYLLIIQIYFNNYYQVIIPFSWPFYYLAMHDNWYQVFFFPMGLYCLLMLVLQQCYQQILMRVLAFAIFGFLASYYLQQTAWAYHCLPAFSLAILIAVLGVIFLPKKSLTDIQLILFLSCLFIYPLLSVKEAFKEGKAYYAAISPLSHFISSLKRASRLYFISATPRYIFPMAYSENIQYVSRFEHLFWVPTLAKYKNPHVVYANALNHMVAADIFYNRPDYIFIDMSQNKPFFSGHEFNYLKYLKSELLVPNHYHLFTYLIDEKYHAYQYVVLTYHDL